MSELQLAEKLQQEAVISYHNAADNYEQVSAIVGEGDRALVLAGIAYELAADGLEAANIALDKANGVDWSNL